MNAILRIPLYPKWHSSKSKDLLACHAVFDETGLYFGAYICLLLCLQFSKALKDLLSKLGTIIGGCLLYNSSTNHSLNCTATLF